jgi:hypothetical protein
MSTRRRALRVPAARPEPSRFLPHVAARAGGGRRTSSCVPSHAAVEHSSKRDRIVIQGRLRCDGDMLWRARSTWKGLGMKKSPATQRTSHMRYSLGLWPCRIALAASVWLGMGCTSIAPVSKPQLSERTDEQPTSQISSVQTGQADKIAVESATCERAGAIRCAAADSVERLICKDAHWEKSEPCAANERCDANGGSGDAQCKSLASECVGREAAAPFCTGTELWVCTSDLASTQVSCPSNERCVTRNQLASCDCVPGAKRDEAGECSVGSGCPEGACDAKTTCSVVDGERSCSMCPAGYNGDGLTGCAPLLLDLMPTCGTLQAPVAGDTFDYVITAPLVCQTAQLDAVAAGGAQIEVNGRVLQPAMPWTSAPLAFGDNAVNLTVTEPGTGVSNAYRVTVQHTGQQTQTLRSGNPRAKDFYSWSIAIDGDTLVIGAPWEDGGRDSASSEPVDSGGAHVYVRTAAGWMEQAHLKAQEPREGEFFGASVAVRGNTIVVGATDNDPSDWPASNDRSGAAYAFERSGDTWTQTQRLVASSPTGRDIFGHQLVLSEDTLVVSAPFDATVGMESGALYVYDRLGSEFREVQKLVPSRRGYYTSIGSALALDGDTLIAGGCTDSATVYDGGVVYIFARRNDMWSEQQYLQGPMLRDGTFGYSVAVSGDMLAIGAPRAQRVAAGETDAPLPNGEVYLFERDGERWTQTSVLKAPVPRQSDRFGSSLAITPSMLAVGAAGDASAARGLQGDVNDSSAPASGAVYLYARQSGEPARTTFVKAEDSASGIALGRTLAASEQVLVVGAPYEAEGKSGAAFVFE